MIVLSWSSGQSCKLGLDNSISLELSYGQDTIHAEKGCVEMLDFCMAALMFHTGHGTKARTHAHMEITHFQTQCNISTWKALGLQPHASQALMMQLIGKCMISAWIWVLTIFSYNPFSLWALISYGVWLFASSSCCSFLIVYISCLHDFITTHRWYQPAAKPSLCMTASTCRDSYTYIWNHANF